MFVHKKSILCTKNTFPVCWFQIDEVKFPYFFRYYYCLQFFQNETDVNAESYNKIPHADHEQTKYNIESTFKLCSSVKNVNSDDDEWETKILKYGWSPKHIKLFGSVVTILDNDRLARLAYVGNKRFEGVQRRTLIDKSADRMRKSLATVAQWDTQLIQWLHGLLMEFLPPSYQAAYLDIMQSLKSKLPSLVDKMIFWKPSSVNQELLAPILKRPWQPALNNKVVNLLKQMSFQLYFSLYFQYRKLPGNALLVVISSAAPRLTPQSSRVQKLYTLFTTMAPMLPVQLNINSNAAQKQSLQSVSEQMISISRTKIQELKDENPDRRIILIGMNSASALAMQVALVEQVSGVVCFGFSYNTVHGVRGQADDHLLETSAPILFLIGQNAARSNEEEIEFFREKLSAPSSTCVIGSADDYLRISKTKRRLEGVTQEMVDNMVVDEIADFATKCLQRPLPKMKTMLVNVPRREIDSSNIQMRKRKISAETDVGKITNKTQKLMRPTSTSDDMLEMAVQSILPDQQITAPAQSIKSNQKLFGNRIVPGMTLKLPRSQSNQNTSVVPTKYITITGQKFGQVLPSGQRSSSRPSTPTASQYNNRSGNVKTITPQNQQVFSPTKYTIVRSSTSAKNATGHIAYINEGDLSGTNIFDMPIVFADNDGNIDEEGSDAGSVISIASDSPPAVVKQIVLKTTSPNATISNAEPSSSFTVTKNKNILIQRPAAGKIMINGTVIGKQVSANNIIIPKAQISKFASATKMVKTTPPLTNKKIEILNNTIIKSASSGTTFSKVHSGSFVNLADAKSISGSRLTLPITSPTMKNQIIIKTNSLKPYTGTQLVPSQIGGNKQLGNLTVKRLNVVPSISKIFKKN